MQKCGNPVISHLCTCTCMWQAQGDTGVYACVHGREASIDSRARFSTSIDSREYVQQVVLQVLEHVAEQWRAGGRPGPLNSAELSVRPLAQLGPGSRRLASLPRHKNSRPSLDEERALQGAGSTSLRRNYCSRFRFRGNGAVQPISVRKQCELCHISAPLQNALVYRFLNPVGSHWYLSVCKCQPMQ